ncbi:MAG TPA: substrate-binding domain-containing protein, partial [Acidimicrobiales bacterium]|nr:substrate-binding domain-containing protein [Acidimicrobiales bacterium]
ILIAVAAAAALYLWLVVWQGNLTKGIGQPGAQATLTIGGSTSVYPFTSLGVSWFEQNNSDVVISDNQGGTGAGMVAVCEGNVDLGASSTPQTVSTMETSYGCSNTYASTLTIENVAFDAVDVITASTSTHGLLSISADTLNAIYEAGSTTSNGHYIGSINGAVTPAGLTVVAGTPLEWQQIPASVAGSVIELQTSGLPAALITYFTTGAGETCGASHTLACEDVNDTQAAAAGGYTAGTSVALAAGTVVGSPSASVDGITSAAAGAPSDTLTNAGTSGCGWTICASGAVGIVPVARSDASGTTQTFEAKLLGYGSGATSSSSSWVGASPSSAAQNGATSFANLGYGGCGSNNLLSDCGFTIGTTGNGNPGVISAVSGNVNAIGYASDGDARASGSGVSIVPFLGLGQGIGGAGIVASPGSGTYAFGGVVPTTGTSGTIAAGLTSSTSIDQYVGGRPFQLISLEPFSGVSQEFITFITDPAVNAALAAATHEVGLYSVIV